MSRTILVSACLLGLNTRYNAIPRRDEPTLAWLKTQKLTPVPVCPEQLAGLPTPRPPCQFTTGDGNAILDGGGGLCSGVGEDLGAAFSRGAAATLEIARLSGSDRALLKERSPSCGRHFVHCADQLVPGQGVACALLLRAGLTVLSEEDLPR